MTSPYFHTKYKVGKTYTVDDFSDDERLTCAPGINVATIDWCLREIHCNLDKIYIEVEFSPEDIVAIPYNNDGKFRVKKIKVIRIIPRKELEEYLKPLYPGNRG
jgi:hypothetical protein